MIDFPKVDITILKSGTFAHGDCMDFLPYIPTGYFDLVFSDRQFGIGEDGSKTYKSNVKQSNGTQLQINTMVDDVVWDNDIMPQSYYDEIFRVGKYHIITGDNYLPFDQHTSSTGRIIWNKNNGNSDQSDCEIFWTNLFQSVRMFNYTWHGHRQGQSITNGLVQRGNKKLNEKKIQRCQKPVNLYRWCFSKFAKKGWKILFTHAGSASGLIACESLNESHGMNLRCVGFEKLKSHFDKSSIRINEFISNPIQKQKVIKTKSNNQLKLL